MLLSSLTKEAQKTIISSERETWQFSLFTDIVIISSEVLKSVVSLCFVITKFCLMMEIHTFNNRAICAMDKPLNAHTIFKAKIKALYMLEEKLKSLFILCIVKVKIPDLNFS